MAKPQYTPEEIDALNAAARAFPYPAAFGSVLETYSVTKSSMDGDHPYQQLEIKLSALSSRAFSGPKKKFNDAHRSATNYSDDWDRAKAKALARVREKKDAPPTE